MSGFEYATNVSLSNRFVLIMQFRRSKCVFSHVLIKSYQSILHEVLCLVRLLLKDKGDRRRRREDGAMRMVIC